MSKSDRVSDAQDARGRFNDALRAMERFVMNLDPARVQGLRDWLRDADADVRPDRLPAPPLKGLALAEQTGEHLQAVLAARTAWRKADRLLHSPPQRGLAPPAGLR